MSTVAFATLGCKVNQDESLGLEALFARAGFTVVPFGEGADIYVVNTCTVTHLGSRKSRQLLRQAKRANPESLVVAAGCYPQTAPEELQAIGEVDLIVGNSHKHRLVELVEQALKDKERRVLVEEPGEFTELPLAPTARQRSTLKIQEGCRRFCTYCIVPYARGGLRSMPPAQVVEKALALEDMGFREIVLTGINLTSYGKEGTEYSLVDVIQGLKVISRARIRLSSVEPNDFSPALLEAIKANPLVCRHFHIPLQSGSDKVLAAMGRKYTRQEYLNLINTLKAVFHLPSFSTDIIVGFPGEEESDFDQLLDMVREVGFSRLHVFRYSPRQGTPAARYPRQVPEPIKGERSRLLTELGETIALEYGAKLIGEREYVLAEEESELYPGGSVGYGERYLRIHTPESFPLGSTHQVEVTGQRGSHLVGRLV